MIIAVQQAKQAEQQFIYSGQISISDHKVPQTNQPQYTVHLSKTTQVSQSVIRINSFTPKFKKYILPNFYREMYMWCKENLVVHFFLALLFGMHLKTIILNKIACTSCNITSHDSWINSPMQ